METIVNKIEKSGLITLDLVDFLPKNPVVELDIKQFLWQGMILREKEFRSLVKEFDWNQFESKNVAIFCSEDTIVANWAYMNIASQLHGLASRAIFGSKEELENKVISANISNIDTTKYRDKLILIKGCGSIPVPTFAFTEIVNLLQPVVKSLMYGEACSSVPVFKKKKN